MRYLQPHTGGKQNRLFIIFLSFCFIIFNQSGLPEPVRIQPEPHGSSPEPANDKNTKKKDKNSRFSAFSIFLLHVSIWVQIYHFFNIFLSFVYRFLIVFSSFPNLCIIFLENLWIISQHVYRFHSPESNRNLVEAARNPQMMKKTIKK